jgi:predicted peptidase
MWHIRLHPHIIHRVRRQLMLGIVGIVWFCIVAVPSESPVLAELKSKVASVSAVETRDEGVLGRSVSIHGTIYEYEVFLPAGWSPRRRWPIILFLHGAGERGSDGLVQTQVGIGEAIRKNRSRFPAIVVMPQCPIDHWWVTADMEELALASLGEASKEFKGDAKRIYLTGLSMGAYGTWDIAAKNPHKFAAIVPISGGIAVPEIEKHMHPDLADASYPDEPASYANVAAKIGKTPVWIFHGADDKVVSPNSSRKMFAALRESGANVRYTEYPHVGHNSWEKAYADPELTTWLFSKSL